MLFYSIYNLFSRGYSIFLFKKPLFFILKSLLNFLIITTNIFYILDSICYLTTNKFAQELSQNIFFVFYYIPIFAIFYIIHNIKIAKTLEIAHFKFKKPSHIYLTFFSLFIYIISWILTICTDRFYILYYLGNTLANGLFLCELVFPYVNYSYYNYKNVIDFFNTQPYIFLFYGGLITIILDLIPKFFIIPISYFLFIYISNSLIYLSYSKYTQVSFNYLRVFEFLYNHILKYFIIRIQQFLYIRKNILVGFYNQI